MVKNIKWKSIDSHTWISEGNDISLNYYEHEELWKFYRDCVLVSSNSSIKILCFNNKVSSPVGVDIRLETLPYISFTPVNSPSKGENRFDIIAEKVHYQKGQSYKDCLTLISELYEGHTNYLVSSIEKLSLRLEKHNYNVKVINDEFELLKNKK